VEIGAPGVAHTQTFISFGSFDTEDEALALVKYIKSKFVRALLGVLKVTPDNARKDIWQYIPLQKLNSDSDIDWKLPISLIDVQLYKKYRLSKNEIAYIEENVSEMN